VSRPTVPVAKGLTTKLNPVIDKVTEVDIGSIYLLFEA